MANKYLSDISFLSNGGGAQVYGGRLEAYTFQNIAAAKLFERFSDDVHDAIGKKYFPVYRMADGELHFLFGFRINWRRQPILDSLRYLKYGLFRMPRKTSWAESYPPREIRNFRHLLAECVLKISKQGKLAIYWNENGLNAYSEYNGVLERSFRRLGINLSDDNYIPFHFCQGLLAKHITSLANDRNILVVSSVENDELECLRFNLLDIGAAHVEFFKCSKNSALGGDYSNIKRAHEPDIVLVAAGIGSAKVLADLDFLRCPVLDIGSFIHVLSGRDKECHAGFFVSPLKGIRK